MGALPPNPRFSAFLPSQVDFFYVAEAEDGETHPQPGPAPESALGLRPRIALPSAQVAWSVSQYGQTGTLTGAARKKQSV